MGDGLRRFVLGRSGTDLRAFPRQLGVEPLDLRLTYADSSHARLGESVVGLDEGMRGGDIPRRAKRRGGCPQSEDQQQHWKCSHADPRVPAARGRRPVSRASAFRGERRATLRYARALGHVERQLGQAAPAAPAPVARRAPARRVCLQETKLSDDAFEQLLGDELAGRGYASALCGEVQWNGVAILSRVGLDDVVTGIAGAPGFPHPEARAAAATCAGIRVYCVYVPNGREPGSEHYRYKLAWLRALRDVVRTGPRAAIVCGDMNIAPADIDVFDPRAYAGHTHVTPAERAALAELEAARPA